MGAGSIVAEAVFSYRGGPSRHGLPQLSPSARLQLAVLVGIALWLEEGGLVDTGFVFVSKVRLLFFPNTLNSAFPSFSIPLTQRRISAGVAAISAAVAIQPLSTYMSLSLQRDYLICVSELTYERD